LTIFLELPSEGDSELGRSLARVVSGAKLGGSFPGLEVEKGSKNRLVGWTGSVVVTDEVVGNLLQTVLEAGPGSVGSKIK